MMDYFRHKEKRAAIREAEAKGDVADSMNVRLELIRRMNAGELTLAQVQTELKRIKRNAKANGKTTRATVYRQS